MQFSSIQTVNKASYGIPIQHFFAYAYAFTYHNDTVLLSQVVQYNATK